MGLRVYLLLIGLGTVLSWFAWCIVLFTMSPVDSGWIGFSMFYITFGTALAGTLTLLFSIIRVYLLHRNVIEREIRTSFRHAVLCALITIASLALSASGHFSFWYTLGLLIVSVTVEYLFLQAHRGKG
jgi:hypothetical protein